MKLLAVALSSTLLVACGGGGGGSAAGGTTGTTISGAAVKGPMSKAKISIYKIKSDGTKGDLLTTTTSGDDGSYTATVNGYSGVVIVEASVTPGTTTMYDEATGQSITPEPGFVMRASLATEAGKPVSAQINPFTEAATTAALAKAGGFNSANVAQANKDMKESLQFDPLTIAATFDANKRPTNSAAVALAAVSEMANSSLLGCTSGTQAAKVACISSAMATKSILANDVKSALQTQLNAVADTLSTTRITIGVPSETPPSTATALEQTKAFMTSLRSNAKALNAADLSLKTELKAVADDMKGRTAPIAATNIDTLDLTTKAVQFWNDAVVQKTAPFTVSRSFYRPWNGYSNEQMGSCSFFSDINLNTYATNATDAKFVGCVAYIQPGIDIRAVDTNGVEKPCTQIGEWCATLWSMRLRLTPNVSDANQFTLHTKTREAKHVLFADGRWREPVDGNGNYIGRVDYGTPLTGNAATLATQRDGTGRVTSVNLSGELSPGFVIERNPTYTYDNALTQWVYKPNEVAKLFGDKHNVALAGALTQANGIDKLAVSGSMELIKAEALETRIELLAGSYLQAKPDGTGSYVAKDGSHEMLLKLKASTAGSAVSGELKTSAFKTDASGKSYVPTLVSFTGSVQRNGVNFFEGAMTFEALNYASYNSQLALSVSNARAVRLGFDGKVVIQNRPPLKVNLSVAGKNTGKDVIDEVSMSGQYTQGLITINVSGASSAASNIVTLESTNGVKLVMDKSKTSYPLTKGAEVVATYSTVDHKLTYNDNSYEQF